MKISISTESASSTINTHTHYKHSPPPTHPHTQRCSDRKGSGARLRRRVSWSVLPWILSRDLSLPGLLSKGQTHWPLLSLFPKHLHKIASKGLVCSKEDLVYLQICISGWPTEFESCKGDRKMRKPACLIKGLQISIWKNMESFEENPKPIFSRVCPSTVSSTWPLIHPMSPSDLTFLRLRTGERFCNSYKGHFNNYFW